MLLAGIQSNLGLDPRLKHSGMTHIHPVRASVSSMTHFVVNSVWLPARSINAGGGTHQ
jgi:hypothetical protein